MPLYFFDLFNDVDADDMEGKELPDIDAARAHAISEARAMVCASVKESGRIDLRHHIDVRDSTGHDTVVVKFEDAVSVVRAGRPV